MQEITGLSFKDIERKAIEQYLRCMLDHVKADMFKILNKHGVTGVHEMDAWFQEGRIEEADGWEDFFELDRHEHKRRSLERIIEQL